MASTATSYSPSRDDFAAMLDESFAGGNLQESSVIKGTVVAIEKDMAVIDVGLKTEGRVALREFAGPGKESELKVGDVVEVFLDRIENALGEAVLSRDKARREESWGKLEKAFNNNEKVHGVIFNQVKGGFTVDLDGAVAFLPRSQVDIRPIRDVAPLMNNSQPFQILKMDRRRGNIVVSRRTVLEETRAEQRQELVQNLEEGQVIDGVVKNITDYGAFVDLGGIDGLLHVTDIAWRRVNHPTEVLTIGQTVKVKIIKINHETHRISLGMKQLLDDPWQGIEAKYPLNARFTGRVTNITDYGAFVELEPGIEGLIHVSEMSWTKKNMHPGKIVSTSLGSVRREVPGRIDGRGRGQEQDRVRPVPRARGRRRRHGASVRPRLEAAGRAGDRQLQEGRHGQGRGARRRCRKGAHLARRQAARGRPVRRAGRRQEGCGRDLRSAGSEGKRHRR
jgi:small subunit ribosomal protein S1